MDKRKRASLEAAGWTVGSPVEFLGPNEEESAFVEIKLSLSRSLKQMRTSRSLSQVELARHLKSSQSRVAKMEAGDPSVTLDLLVRSLFAIGATRRDIARAIGHRRHETAEG